MNRIVSIQNKMAQMNTKIDEGKSNGILSAEDMYMLHLIKKKN